jgi:hypothetical protein
MYEVRSTLERSRPAGIPTRRPIASRAFRASPNGAGTVGGEQRLVLAAHAVAAPHVRPEDAGELRVQGHGPERGVGLRPRNLQVGVREVHVAHVHAARLILPAPRQDEERQQLRRDLVPKLGVQPGTGLLPVALDGARGDLQRRRRLLGRQPSEEATLDHPA